MAVNLSPVGGVAAQFFTSTGAVLTGGKLYTYLAGTTTPATAYTSSNGSTAWTNPIVLNAAGRVPDSGEIWITDGISYKFILRDSNDVLIATYDNITGINSNSVSFTNQQQIITATANQTVFNLSISYQPGTNSLSVFVDGVNQYGPGAQYAYTETDSDTVTFVSGLHVGASVKFTTTQQQGAGAVNASQVTYNPAGVGAVATNVQAKLRQTVSVADFGAVGNGVADDTAAIQAGITACVASGNILYMPAGTYLVTDTLNCPTKTMIVGQHRSMSAIDNGTKILFQPTTVKSLFSTGPTGTFKDGYSFENLYIVGNSTTSTGNSFRAFDLIKVIKSTFRNMRIDGFRAAFRVEASIMNRFEFIQMANHYLYCIHYTGDVATTDVWEQCYISNAPIGVQTDGINLGIRFNNCAFESLTTYGVNLVKESYSWIFQNTYVEDVPTANVATNAMWRVGYDGATLSGTPQLLIDGGYIAGRNAGLVGSLLDVDFTDGVTLGGFIAARYTNIVKTSANTQTNQIVASGWTAASVSTMVTDATKVSGYYPIGVYNSGTRNLQTARFANILTGPLTLDSGAAATTAGNLQLGRTTDTLVGAAGGASALPATPLGYLIAYLGTTAIKIPYYNA
jgi:hypothetical protein